MKILTGAQLKELDKYTIEHEPISSIDLMERAARALTDAITKRWSTDMSVIVFAGPGNNGGDALAVARMLAEQDYKVSVYLFNIHDKLSDECATNKQRLIEQNKITSFTEVTDNLEPPALNESSLVVDGLFGSGLNKPLTGGFAATVRYINQSTAQVVAIDIPSGLMCDDNTGNTAQSIISADVTLTIGQRKLCMYFDDTERYTGDVEVLDIGLSEEYIKTAVTKYTLVERSMITPLLRRRGNCVNKGTMGHGLLMAGSYGMAGAAVLSSEACLRSGIGKVTVVTPERNNDIIQIKVPEAIIAHNGDDYITNTVNPSQYDAIAAGPGIGQHESTASSLIDILRRADVPTVIDADAINIIANHKTWIQQLHSNTILTPHPKEFDRLTDSAGNGGFDRLFKATHIAKSIHSYIILKGHYSALCLPDGNVLFNSTGNSGMATAGSGDVLTGILLALLARGYTTFEAALVGMYIHGLAGDIAEKTVGKESLMAHDIINHLHEAFADLYNNKDDSARRS